MHAATSSYITQLEMALAAANAEIGRLKAYQDETAKAWTKLTESQEQEIEKLREALYECGNLAGARYTDAPEEAYEWLEAIERVVKEATGEPKRITQSAGQGET